MAQLPRITGPDRWSRLGRWMQPGLAIKRWIIIYVVSLTLIALGLGLVLTHLYRTAPFPEPVYYLTLQFIPRLQRGLLFLLIGAGLMIWAVLQLGSSMIGLLVPHYRGRLGDALYAQKILTRGPKVVAIGGGTGLSSLLRGLKAYTTNITAVVTVCDDGGSSGRLRRDLQLLPPGDFRQCIAALADSDPLVTRLFEHRFQSNGGDLKGHAFGNLFIAALAQITGSFEKALEESSRVLAVRGRILPSTLEDVTLCAELEDHSTVEGESRIPEIVSGLSHGGAPAWPARASGQGSSGDGERHGAGEDASGTTKANPIQRVYLQPDRPAVYPEVVRSLLDADLIIIGPGSLFTSILPNLLVDDLARALCWSRAAKVYVCNVATQPGETDEFDVLAHVRTLNQHLEERLGISLAGRRTGDPLSVPFTHVLVNTNLSPELPAEWAVTRPAVSAEALADLGIEVIGEDVVDEARPTRHDPQKLARVLMAFYASARPDPIALPLAGLRALLRPWRLLGSAGAPLAPARVQTHLAD